MTGKRTCKAKSHGEMGWIGMKLGCYVSMSTPDYVLGSVKEAVSYGANVFMLYTGAPQNTRRKTMHKPKVEEAHSLMKEHGIDEDSMIVHAPYTINLANCVREETFALGVEFLQKEIARVRALHATVLVLYPGSHVKAGEEEGLKRTIEGLDLAMQDVQDAQISIRTMAGKGSEIGYNFAHVRYMMDHAKYGDCLRVYLDTCHIHDVSYDLFDFDKMLDEFDVVIGLERLAYMHINDSKNVQRACEGWHANIGFGEIGFEKLNATVHNERVKDVVKILETPYVKDHPPYRQEIAMLKSGVFDRQIMEKIKGDI